MRLRSPVLLASSVIIFLALACRFSPLAAVTNLPPTPAITPSATPSQTPLPTPTHTPSPTSTFTPEPTATETPFPEPQGCRKPPEDYTRVEINGWTLDMRTVDMLKYAQDLWGGAIDLSGWAVTQGSYHDNGAASFGTHLGGGAVDLSVFSPPDWTVHTAEIENLVHVLRIAGFAAWLRLPNEVFEGSGIHIHAIAIGDAELSQAALDQLTGKYGYFRGFNGLPQADGVPVPDRYGEPVICKWMAEMGYRDLRGEPSP